MGRQALGLLTALPVSIAELAGLRNPVTRIGALPEVQAEKAALGNVIGAELDPAKTSPRKERRSLSRNGYRGSRHPLPLTPRWMAKGYLHHVTMATTAMRKLNGGDRDWPTLRAVQVNTIERASKETVSLPSVVTFAGGRAVSTARLSPRQAKD